MQDKVRLIMLIVILVLIGNTMSLKQEIYSE